MTEKINKIYLKEAIEHIKKIYKNLGYSPNAAEYDKVADIEFKLRRINKNNIKLNQLKEAAGIPKRVPGIPIGSKAKSIREYIHCRACDCTIADKECVPGYKEEFCTGCPVRQKDNAKQIPDLPEELEASDRITNALGNSFMNGNDVYLIDVGVIYKRKDQPV